MLSGLQYMTIYDPGPGEYENLDFDIAKAMVILSVSPML